MPKNGSTIKSRRIDSRNDRDPWATWNSARNFFLILILYRDFAECNNQWQHVHQHDTAPEVAVSNQQHCSRENRFK